MQRLLTSVALTVALAAGVHAQQWPTWRGPASSGVSADRGLPTEWSDTSGIAWKASVRGLGISSPIVWNDAVIVTSQVGTGEVRQGPRLVQGGSATRLANGRWLLSAPAPAR